jgi:hypothetical protein
MTPHELSVACLGLLELLRESPHGLPVTKARRHVCKQLAQQTAKPERKATRPQRRKDIDDVIAVCVNKGFAERFTNPLWHDANQRALAAHLKAGNDRATFRPLPEKTYLRITDAGRATAYRQTASAPVVATPAAVKKVLASWPEILAALSEKSKAKIRNLHKAFPGPIHFRGQGAPPMVDKAELIDWWNKLTVEHEVGYNRARDAQPTAAEQHPFGQNGIAVPAIAGGVKRRRAPAK